MNLVRESAIYRLLLTLWSLYRESALCDALQTAGNWCSRQIDQSRVVAFLCKESILCRSWESSLLCKFLTVAVNLPIRGLQWLYRKLQSLMEGSFFAGLAFEMGRETAIAQSWLILLLWVIPYQHWSNAYTLVGFVLLLGLFCLRGMHEPGAALDVASLGFYPVLFFVTVCISALLSTYPGLSMRFLTYHAGAGLCLLVTVSAVRHLSDLKRLAAGATGAMAVASLYAVYQRIQGVDVKSAYVDSSLNPDMPGRVFSFYDNPNSFAAFLILLIPIGAALTLCSKRWLTRLLAGGATALGALAVIMTYSRACWVGFAVAAAVFVFLWKPRLIPLCVALCLLCVPFLPSSIWDRILSIFNFSDSSTSSRWALYEAALNAIRSSPLLGVGLGTAAPQQYIAENALYSGNHLYVHAHNIYLEVWLETGLVGILALLGGVFCNIRNAARQARHSTNSAARLITLGAASALCGIMVAGLADYPWHYPRVMSVFWFVFAMAIAGVKICRAEKNT